MRRNRELLLEEAVCDGRQRHAADDRVLSGRRLDGSNGDRGELRDRRVLEELARSQSDPALFRLPHNLKTENGIAAKFEEVVAYADAIDVQHLFPHTCQLLLDISLRRRKRLLQFRPVGLRRRQAPAIHLPGRQLRKRVEKDEGRWDHVVGQ